MSLRRNNNFESVTLSVFPSQMKRLLEMQASDPACPSLSYLLRKMVIDKLGADEKPQVHARMVKRVQPKKAKHKPVETKTEAEAK